jgi:hypothetical protein
MALPKKIDIFCTTLLLSLFSFSCYSAEARPELFRQVGERFASVQMIDLEAVYADINTPENRKWARENLSRSLDTLIRKGARLFAYGEGIPNPGTFSLREPFIPAATKKIILSPFCQAGRNRSQTLKALLTEFFGKDPRVRIRSTHGSISGLDPYRNRDGSWSLLDNKDNFMQATEDPRDVVMYNAAQKGFIERFGRKKSHRFLEDELFAKPWWDEVAFNDHPESKRIKNQIHNIFTKKYYGLEDPEATYVFIGFGNAFHRLVTRVVESNIGKRNFRNLVLVVLDYPDLISAPRSRDIPCNSKEAYDTFYNLLRKHITE